MYTNQYSHGSFCQFSTEKIKTKIARISNNPIPKERAANVINSTAFGPGVAGKVKR